LCNGVKEHNKIFIPVSIASKGDEYEIRRAVFSVIAKLTCMFLSGVQVEDSATIECAAGKPSTRKASQVLAVCG